MANLTLTQARTRVLRLLDDPNGITGTSRYNPDGSFTDVDQALGFALSGCMSRFAPGSDRFDLEETATSSATTGQADLSSIPKLMIKGVAVQQGDQLFKIPEKPPIRRGLIDYNARSLVVTYVRDYAIPTTTSHPLVGVGATAAPSFPSFDEWVCVCAAQHLTPNDNDLRERLEMLAGKVEADVAFRPNTPTSGPWPRPEPRRWAFIDVQWQWKPSTSIVYLTRGAW